jgi:hypothetical protein
VLQDEPELLHNWHPVWGDRITELVFIGIDLDQDEVICSLDPCLLTDAEMEMDWSKLQDPLPAWPEQQACELISESMPEHIRG